VSLNRVGSGQKVKVKNINNLSVRSALLNIGVLRDDNLEVIRKSFLGSPLYLRADNGLFFALRTNEAKSIDVEEL